MNDRLWNGSKDDDGSIHVLGNGRICAYGQANIVACDDYTERVNHPLFQRRIFGCESRQATDGGGRVREQVHIV